MALGDIFEARLSGVHTSGQPFNIVQHYVVSSVASDLGTAGQLAIEFADEIFTPMVTLMTSSWETTGLHVVNYMNDSDYAESNFSAPGVLAGASLPPVCTVSVRSGRQDIGHNRGRHNLPLGGAAMLATDGSLTEASRDAFYFLVRNFGLPLTSPGGAEFTPCTVEKTYVSGVLTSVVVRSELTGQWQINRWLGTQKTRQSYLWEVPDEPE